MSIRSRRIAENKKRAMVRKITKREASIRMRRSRSTYPGITSLLMQNYAECFFTELPQRLRAMPAHKAALFYVIHPDADEISMWRYTTVDMLASLFADNWKKRLRPVHKGELQNNVPIWNKQILKALQECKGIDQEISPTMQLRQRMRHNVMSLICEQRLYNSNEQSMELFFAQHELKEVVRHAPIIAEMFSEQLLNATTSLTAICKPDAIRKAEIKSRFKASAAKDDAHYRISCALAALEPEVQQLFKDHIFKMWKTYNLWVKGFDYSPEAIAAADFKESVMEYRNLIVTHLF